MKTTEITRLFEIIHKLLGPDGCEWDKAQTNYTLAEDTLEEGYEFYDALINNRFSSYPAVFSLSSRF